MNREEYISGLRAAATFYEEHPEIVLPYDNNVTNYSVNTRAEAAMIVKALGSCEKEYRDDLFSIVKEISPNFYLRFILMRGDVCERVKVAEKVIPAHTLPAREETFVPEKVEEVFEWKCPKSLLAEGAQ